MPTALQQAFTYASNWLSGLDQRHVGATSGLKKLQERLNVEFPETGTPPEQVIDDLVAMTKGGLLGNASGRFFAWVIGGSTESALAADWLVSTWDQNAALYGCGPAVSVIEEIAGNWMKELLDLPREASFAFTTGCQLAHFTALAAARHAVLKRVGWNVAENGLFGAPKIRILVSDQKHGSVERAVNYLGLGSRCIVPLRTNPQGQIVYEELAGALDDSPTILILNAADLNIGACDLFNDLIPLAHKAGAWVHIDGAFGLFARTSRARRHMLDGVDLADSWATDAHKWLNVPFDCGMAIIKDADAHKAAMTLSASYITANDGARDQLDWNPEWSRRARGVPVYAALRELGRQGVEDLVDRCCDYCSTLTTGIGELHGADIVVQPTLNQGLVCFIHPDSNATPEDQDTYNDKIIEAINTNGEAFFSGTTWQGRRTMRISVVNWRTTITDIERAITATANALEQYRK